MRFFEVPKKRTKTEHKFTLFIHSRKGEIFTYPHEEARKLQRAQYFSLVNTEIAHEHL